MFGWTMEKPPETSLAEGIESGLLAVSAWREILRSRPEAVAASLAEIYGPSREHIRSRLSRLGEMLEVFAASFEGDPPVAVARAPGRVNLMGRHVDHRGGYINTIAIHNDVWIVAAARNDGRVIFRDLDPQFGPYEIDPSALCRASDRQPWHEFIESPEVNAHLAADRGAWANYGLGAFLRLRREFGRRVPAGLSAVVWGDVPVSVGLSSSSSVFVATAIAIARLGAIEIEAGRLVELCGEGEWFVGTRGGAGDHAAMIYGRRGMISQIGFHPIHLAGQAELPRDLEIILCNSGQRAEKSRHARDRFNARVAAYEIALALLRRRCPDLIARVNHLRDINPAFLGVGVDRIYEALKSLPLWMTRQQVHDALPGEADRIETWFASHGDHEGGYPLRAVLLFGIAECERSRQALDALRSGDFDRIARLFAVSHDGDRVSRPAGRGERRSWSAEVGDDYLDRLIRLARSDDPAEREKASLAHQPGAYGCSTPEIDEMVDIATATEGVVGAQLVGAGLGGSIVVLARSGTAEKLARNLGEKYYSPRGLETEVRRFQPAAGAGCLHPAG